MALARIRYNLGINACGLNDAENLALEEGFQPIYDKNIKKYYILSIFAINSVWTDSLDL